MCASSYPTSMSFVCHRTGATSRLEDDGEDFVLASTASTTPRASASGQRTVDRAASWNTWRQHRTSPARPFRSNIAEHRVRHVVIVDIGLHLNPRRCQRRELRVCGRGLKRRGCYGVSFGGSQGPTPRGSGIRGLEGRGVRRPPLEKAMLSRLVAAEPAVS